MLELTILMPCLNEEANIGYCIDQAKGYLHRRGIAGEILIVDNDSSDRSVEIARNCGANVLLEPRRGYGQALRTGLEAAKGNVIIFGDCDSTYDFTNLDPFYEPLTDGTVDFITGDRFAGLMEEGAMSFSHRLGVPFLSWCGRVKFGINIHDWHCGIRGITKTAYQKLNLQTDGMEFATEMIAEASRKGLKIAEVPVPLRKSLCERKEKLRTVRDGVRHLWYIVRG